MKNKKPANEAMQRDWSMREIKETEYQELLKTKEAYDKLMNADGGEALESVNELLESAIAGNSMCDNCGMAMNPSKFGETEVTKKMNKNDKETAQKIIKFIHKSTATEKELDELKKELNRFKNNTDVCYKCGSELVDVLDVDSQTGQIWYCSDCEQETEITNLLDWEQRKGADRQ